MYMPSYLCQGWNPKISFWLLNTFGLNTIFEPCSFIVFNRVISFINAIELRTSVYLMFIGDLNLYFIIFFLIMVSLSTNVTSALHLLLTAELLWVTLYIIVLNMGILYDNVNLLSLTFFFLVLSAVEFGIGIVLILVQNVFLRSIYLSDNSKNWLKYNTRFLLRIKNSKLPSF